MMSPSPWSRSPASPWSCGWAQLHPRPHGWGRGKSDSTRKTGMLFPVKGGERLGRQKTTDVHANSLAVNYSQKSRSKFCPENRKGGRSYRFNYLCFLSERVGPQSVGFLFVRGLVTFSPYSKAHSICQAHLTAAQSAPGWEQKGQEALLCLWQSFMASFCPSVLMEGLLVELETGSGRSPHGWSLVFQTFFF